jgi:uncharacterized protein (DUF1697 family)
MRYVAFLRAVNIRGRQVKMAELKARLDELGYDNVSTFIASGNVIFESSKQPTTLEREIEAHLKEWLGFDVGVILRSDAEVQAIAAHDPFGEEGTTYVVLLRAEPNADARKRVEDLATEDDLLAIHGREVYWKPRMFHFSKMGGQLASVLGKESTVRNANTLRRLADKFHAQAPRPSRKRSASVSTAKP